MCLWEKKFYGNVSNALLSELSTIYKVISENIDSDFNGLVNNQ
jgi:hypothetical protein